MISRALAGVGGPILGLTFVTIIFSALVGPNFLAGDNLELIVRQTAVVGAAALGMTMVIVSAGIDLSVGSVVALTTVVIALMLRSNATPAVAALAGVGAAAVCGAVNGLLVIGLRVVPFIVTLGTMILVRGAAKGLAEERRIEAPTTWLNGLLQALGRGEGLLVPSGIWLVVLLALLVAGTLRYTRFGRHLFAIGSNERTARLCGVAVERCKLAVYALTAALAGVAGVLQFPRLSVGDPTVRARRDDNGGDSNRLRATRSAELGAADCDRRNHRAGGRAGSLEEQTRRLMPHIGAAARGPDVHAT